MHKPHNFAYGAYGLEKTKNKEPLKYNYNFSIDVSSDIKINDKELACFYKCLSSYLYHLYKFHESKICEKE